MNNIKIHFQNQIIKDVYKRQAFDMDDEKIKNYRPCKCCCSLNNIYKNLKPELKGMFADSDIEVKSGENFLLVNTPSYNWRVDFTPSNQKLKLYAGSLYEEQQEYTWIRWSECESTGNLQSVMQVILNEEKLAEDVYKRQLIGSGRTARIC